MPSIFSTETTNRQQSTLKGSAGLPSKKSSQTKFIKTRGSPAISMPHLSQEENPTITSTQPLVLSNTVESFPTRLAPVPPGVSLDEELRDDVDEAHVAYGPSLKEMTISLRAVCIVCCCCVCLCVCVFVMRCGDDEKVCVG
jgi:hypothetical protein